MATPWVLFVLGPPILMSVTVINEAPTHNAMYVHMLTEVFDTVAISLRLPFAVNMSIIIDGTVLTTPDKISQPLPAVRAERLADLHNELF